MDLSTLTLLICFLLLIIFVLVGSAVAPIRNHQDLGWAFRGILGICVSLILCYAAIQVPLANKNQTISLLILSHFLLVIIGLIKLLKDKNRSKKAFLKASFICLSAGFLFLVSYTGSIYVDSVKQRVGPDMLGWVASAQYIEKEWSLKSLQEWLNQEFPKTSNEVIFSREALKSRNSIYFTSSYTKQIQAEFLIGAKRIAIPAFIGFYMHFFNFASWTIVYLSLMALFHGLLFLFVFELFYKRINSRSPTRSTLVLCAATSLFSASVLTPIFEGGFGQQVSYLIFIVLVSTFIFSIPTTLLAIVVLAGYLAYPELYFMTLPIVLIIGYTKILDIQKNKSKGTIKLQWFSFLLIGTAITLQMLPLALRKVNEFGLSGWNVSINPLPTDLMNIGGFYSWKSTGFPTDASYLLSFLISIFAVICTFVFVRLKWVKFVIVSSLIWYDILLIASWISNNNYNLWKSLPYFSLAFCIFLLNFYRVSMVSLRTLYRYVSLSLCSSLLFIIAWNVTSENIQIYQFSSQERVLVREIVDNFALNFKGVNYVNTFALLGDMEWGSKSRQIPDAIAEISDRPIAWVIPSEICSASPEKSKILFNSKGICIVDLNRD